MIIRLTQPPDIPNLFLLIEKICDFHQLLDCDRYHFLPNQGALYETWLSELLLDSRNLCLVAEDEALPGSRLIGYAIATLEVEIPIYHLQEYGYIHDLWIEEPYRHQGIARQMVMQTIDHFKQLGIQQIRLNTVVGNDAALKLYTNCGFRPSTIEMLIAL